MVLLFQAQNNTANFQRLLVTWSCYKNLSTNFFDDSFTRSFFNHISKPNFSMPSRNVMAKYVQEEFLKMRENLKKILSANNSKFAFTFDGWTSEGSTCHYGITVHYIDNEWNSVSAPLDLVAANGQHSGRFLAQLFFSTLTEFGIEKSVQGITMDNAPSNTTFIHALAAEMEKHDIKFSAENQHFRCFCHMLNLGAQDVLKLIGLQRNDNDKLTVNEKEDNLSVPDCDPEENIQVGNIAHVVCKVRNLCKKIRASEQLTINLENLCTAVNTPFLKPILDVCTRWNSTCDMLSTAYRLKIPLEMLTSSSSNLRGYAIHESEWIIVNQLLNFLTNFKKISVLFSGEDYPTLPIAVVGMNLLIDKLEKIVFDLDNRPERNSLDETLIMAVQAGRDKLLKHYKKTNWIYCISLILDPRHKVKSFDCTSWGAALKEETVRRFEKIYKDDYYSLHHQEQDVEDTVPIASSTEEDEINLNALYVQNQRPSHWKNEITEYLNSPQATQDVNILSWWKTHQELYPILAQMARDYLAIMASSVPVERLFSAASLIMTKNRCAMKSESLRARLCVNAWSKCKLRKEICEIEIPEN